MSSVFLVCALLTTRDFFSPHIDSSPPFKSPSSALLVDAWRNPDCCKCFSLQRHLQILTCRFAAVHQPLAFSIVIAVPPGHGATTDIHEYGLMLTKLTLCMQSRGDSP